MGSPGGHCSARSAQASLQHSAGLPASQHDCLSIVLLSLHCREHHSAAGGSRLGVIHCLGRQETVGNFPGNCAVQSPLQHQQPSSCCVRKGQTEAEQQQCFSASSQGCGQNSYFHKHSWPKLDVTQAPLRQMWSLIPIQFYIGRHRDFLYLLHLSTKYWQPRAPRHVNKHCGSRLNAT